MSVMLATIVTVAPKMQNSTYHLLGHSLRRVLLKLHCVCQERIQPLMERQIIVTIVIKERYVMGSEMML